MRFLAVDEDPESRAALVERLEREWGSGACRGVGGQAELAEALAESARAGAGALSAVVCEQRLSWGDGLAVLRQVRESFPALPFIIYTVHDSAEAAVAALRAGASDYILKPDVERVAAAARASAAPGGPAGVQAAAQPTETSSWSKDGAAGTAIEPQPDGNPSGTEVADLNVREQAVARREADATRRDAVWHADAAERRWTQEELGRQAALLRQQAHLLDLTVDAVMVRDLNATILFWNRGAAERYGWTREEALGQRSHTLLKTEFPQPVEEVYATLLRDGHWSGELVHTRRDGSRLVVDSRWALQRDDQGRPLAVLDINSEITERKRAEEALRERERALRLSEERYRQMFEKNRAIKLLVDPESGRIVQANPAACEYYGYPLEQLQQMKIWQVNMLPESQLRGRMADAMSGAQSNFMFRHRLASGDVRDVEVFASPIELQGRDLIYSIVHDITDRKQAERALWHHTKRLQILHEIDQAVLAVKSPEAIAQEALHHLRQVVPARHASVLLFDQAGKEAEVLAVEAAGSSHMRAGERLPIEATWAPTGQWQNNVYLIDDLQQAAEPSPGLEGLRREGVRSHMSVPLVAQGQLIGRLNLGSSKTGAFTLQHLDIARQVADSLAVAIQNGRLYEGEQGSRQIAETLRAANVALTQSLDLDAIFATLLDYLARLVPYDSACVMLSRDGGRRMAVAAMDGYEQWADPEQIAELRSVVFDVESTSSIATVVRTQISFMIPDTATFNGWESRPGSQHVRNWLGVPLVARGQLVGICSIDKAEPGFFTADHARLAEALAAQAAVAILNARLFEEVRTGREQLQTLMRRLVEMQERERSYIATELHDGAGQALTSLMVNLGLLQRKAECVQPIAAELDYMKQQVDGVIDALHRLAVNLRPASLDHLGLAPALRQYVEAVRRQSGLVVQLETFGLSGERLPGEYETALFRIIQEALSNVAMHAQATQAGVLLERRGDRLIVIVEDNGSGFDAPKALDEGQLGLLGMRERAEMLGGKLMLESGPGGTSVFVELPWQGED